MTQSKIENQKSKIINDLAAVVLIAALVLLFFWRILTPRPEDRAVFPPGDFTDQFWAFRMYTARAFAQGRLPLWSENFNSGHPFLADVQSAIFYPVGLIYTLAIVALRGGEFTLFDLEVEAMLHFILAGAFTYLFARRLLGARVAALVSAITFTFGGYLTSYPPQQLAILETATWLPLALLFLDLGIGRGRVRTSADVIARTSCPSAGMSRDRDSNCHCEERVLQRSNLQSARWGLLRQKPPRNDRGKSLSSAVRDEAISSELGIASQRPLAMTRDARYYIAAGVVLGIAALAGHPQTFMFVGYTCVIYFVYCVLRVPSESSKFEVQGSRITHHASRIAYCVFRLAVALLIAAGIAAAQWIPTLEYQAVSTRAAITWAEAARGFPTLDPLQMLLPGFVSAFQSPLYIGVLPLWLGIVALFLNRSRDKVFWAALAVGALIVAFGFYVFAYALFYLFVPGFAMFRGQERLALVVSFALAMLAGYGMRELMQLALDMRRLRRAWALLPAGVTISLLMLLTLYISGTVRQSGRVAFLGDRAGLMVLLFMLSSALVAWRMTGDQSPASAGESPINQARATFAALSIALSVFDLFSINSQAYNAEPKPRYPVTPIIQTIQNDRSVFRVVDEGKMPGHFGIAYGLEEIGGISPLRVARYDFLRENLPEEELWQLLNVRYVVTARPGFASAEVIAQEGETRLLRLNDALPRAWLAGAPVVNADDRAVLDAMQSDSFDPRAIVYVAEPPPFPLTPRNAYTPVEFETRAPERLVLTVETPTDQLLVLSEVYYPGWRAFVDGIETPILRANVALRAAPVRAGAHRVEMVFEPWSVKVGIAMTVVTLLAVVGGMWFLRVKRVL